MHLAPAYLDRIDLVQQRVLAEIIFRCYWLVYGGILRLWPPFGLRQFAHIGRMCCKQNGNLVLFWA